MMVAMTSVLKLLYTIFLVYWLSGVVKLKSRNCKHLG